MAKKKVTMKNKIKAPSEKGVGKVLGTFSSVTRSKTERADKKFDKKQGIKQGSKKDKKIDKMKGIPF